jgi:enolase-phosphatase E1
MKRIAPDNVEDETVIQKKAKDEKEVGADSKPKIKAVILDIEGTTTPITFVHDVLFPYVRVNLEKHLTDNWASSELVTDIDALRKLSEELAGDVFKAIPILSDNDENKNDLIKSIVTFVNQLMDEDRKVGALKQLQGHIWLAGYQQGTIKGEVYNDVIEAMDRWNKSSTNVYIYSSGSIAAQKLLFGYSDHGDLLKNLKGHFDTTIGSKLEATSYSKILEDIFGKEGVPHDALFVSDNFDEVKAAVSINMNSVIAVRKGNKELPSDCPYKTYDSFVGLFEDYDFVSFEWK